MLEAIVNRQAWEALSPAYQEILRQATIAQNTWMLAQFDAQNNFYLQKLINEEKVDLRPFPDEVMQTLHGYAIDVLEEVAASDAMSKKVYDSFKKFQTEVSAWANISEKAFYNSIQVDL